MNSPHRVMEQVAIMCGFPLSSLQDILKVHVLRRVHYSDAKDAHLHFIIYVGLVFLILLA